MSAAADRLVRCSCARCRGEWLVTVTTWLRTHPHFFDTVVIPPRPDEDEDTWEQLQLPGFEDPR
jgi:hypothetical protein